MPLDLRDASESRTMIACVGGPFKHTILRCKALSARVLLVIPCPDDFRRRVYDVKKRSYLPF